MTKSNNETEKLPAYHKKIAAKNAHIGGICDFCGIRVARHSINGSLWFICTECMDHHYSTSKMEEEE